MTIEGQKLSQYITEDYLLRIHHKLREEIEKSKTDSKDHHYQQLGVHLMEIGVYLNSDRLFQAGEKEFNTLRPWEKARAYQQIANFLYEAELEKYDTTDYYRKSFEYWKDTLLHEKEPMTNLLGSDTRLLKDLKKAKQKNILKEAASVYPEFINQILPERQHLKWLEYAYLMTDVLPDPKILMLVEKAEEIIQGKYEKPSPSETQILLEFEIAKQLKDEERLFNIYKSLPVSILLENLEGSFGANYKDENLRMYSLNDYELFAKIFFEINAPQKALEILKARIDILLKRWKEKENEGWPMGGRAEKSLFLNEIIKLGEFIVQYRHPEACEKLKPLLTQDFEPGEEVFPELRTALRVKLGWYPENKLASLVSQEIQKLSKFVENVVMKTPAPTPITLFQFIRNTEELTLYKDMAKQIKSNTIQAQIQQFEEEVWSKTQQWEKAREEATNIIEIENQRRAEVGGRQKIEQLLKEKKFEEALPLIQQYEKTIRQQTQRPMQFNAGLYDLVNLYCTIEDYQNAKQIFNEIENFPPVRIMLLQAYSMHEPIQSANLSLFTRLMLKIKIFSKLNILNVTDILNELPPRDSNFAYQLGMELARYGEISAAEQILKEVRPVPLPLQKTSEYHFLCYQIYHELHDIPRAKEELDQAYEKLLKYIEYLDSTSRRQQRGVTIGMRSETFGRHGDHDEMLGAHVSQILEEYNKFLEAYYLLGKQEICHEIIAKSLELLLKDTVLIQGMGFTIPSFLFRQPPEKSPERTQIKQELQKFYQHHLRRLFNESIKSGNNPLSFQGLLTFVRLLERTNLTVEAQELAVMLFITLNRLVAGNFPDHYTEHILNPPDIDNYEIWDTKFIANKLQQDPQLLPASVPITAIFDSPSLSPQVIEKEKRERYFSKYSEGYDRLSVLFKKLKRPQLMEMAYKNSLTCLETLSWDTTTSSHFTQINKYFGHQNYSQGLNLIETVIQALDGSKINSWEFFFPYTGLFEEIEETLAQEQN